ncbi:CDP-alcohol phosphatidyltransferase family protein [Salipaludibacillus agaradhaerens]|uniref:CDP-alcohol phosphatidyltransferase family protein n=1 Tax=Salipaludibacillus agaradhaerens TaxID=76935 RepID=UPI0021513532|nr:CDP-alcohol phosphatidyltransferase family protein [Salipaludibacillus agaradhaerens]MCR6119820.1 CDP-alcohol phosphatidyltransferase family protein [Salipaludibacillus agaradhaerens]
MRSIPNYLSIFRIVLSPFLLLVEPLGGLFFTLYFMCFISDGLDGYIARKTETESRFGAKLDSMADMITFIILMYVLYGIINPTTLIIYWVIMIAFIRATSLIIVIVKYKTFGIVHSYGNKLTGLTLALFPISFFFLPLDLVVISICILASFSAVEELLIHLTSHHFQANRKSLFVSGH